MSESDFRELMLPPTATIHKAIEVMSGPLRAGIILVVDKKTRLLGVVVDSDIRKAILRGKPLDCPLKAVMNPAPVTLAHTTSRAEITSCFRRAPRANLPLVDRRGVVRGLAQMVDYLTQPSGYPNSVVLMVGGLGKRLHPLTETTPKPLLQVGNKPILETIIEQFTSAGFTRFYLAVNHRSEQIRAHFGDGARLGADIRYLHERAALGTAGALSLLPKGLEHPLIVMNGDLLTKVDFKTLLDFHTEESNLATLCVREYDFQVPYGVVHMEEHRLTRIVEKPTHRFFVNAGIYVIDPKVLKLLAREKRRDMPDLLETIRRKKRGAVGCFPVREYWIDIGQIDEYRKAQAEYEGMFRKSR